MQWIYNGSTSQGHQLSKLSASDPIIKTINFHCYRVLTFLNDEINGVLMGFSQVFMGFSPNSSSNF